MSAFATPQELSTYSNGLISPTDERSQPLLDGATKAIQRLAGWNIAPAEDLTLTLDGGGAVLYLPSLQVNSITSVTVDGAVVTPENFEWSRVTGNVRRKPTRRSEPAWPWPEVWGGIVVVFNSGYADIPEDLKAIVLQVVSLAMSSPTGATREQAGQVAMSWGTTAPGVAGGLSLLQRDLDLIASYRIPREA